MARDNVMTEQEAIEVLKNNYPKMCKMVNGRYQGGFDNTESDFGQALTMAISVLKEIQQYREIGTVEELTDFKNMKVRLEKYHANINVSRLIECFIETVFENTKHEGFIILTNQEAKDYEAYCSIGTVEECRKAVEKQKPQKPKDSLKIDPVIDENGAYVDADTTVYLLCPNCREMVGIEDNCDRFCHECGQAIDNENWRE